MMHPLRQALMGVNNLTNVLVTAAFPYLQATPEP
jgi:hypothetical protein